MIGSRVKRQEFLLYDTSGSNRHQPPSYYSDWCLIYSKRNWSSLDARSGRCCWSRLKRKNQTVVYFIWKQKKNRKLRVWRRDTFSPSEKPLTRFSCFISMFVCSFNCKHKVAKFFSLSLYLSLIPPLSVMSPSQQFELSLFVVVTVIVVVRHTDTCRTACYYGRVKERLYPVGRQTHQHTDGHERIVVPFPFRESLYLY